MRKPKFYSKAFSKQDFYTSVRDLILYGKIPISLKSNILDACEYELQELERIKENNAKRKSEKYTWKDCKYAKAIEKDILPLLTEYPMTAKELSSIAPLYETGKPYHIAWIARVLNNNPEVKKEQVITETLTTEGIKKQSIVTAYSI